MGLFKKLGSIFKSDDETFSVSNDAFFRAFGLKDYDVEDLSEATYFTCMKILSEAVGKIPITLQRYTAKGGVVTLDREPLYNIIKTRPNPYMTASVFWSTVELNRNHYGNAYVLIDGAGKNLKLWILPSDKVKVVVDDKRLLSNAKDIYYMYTEKGKQYVFSSDEIIHLKTFNTFNGIVGKSVREQLHETVVGGGKSQKLINDMYDNGFTAKAALQYTGDLDEEKEKRFIKGIENYATGRLKSDGISNIIPLPYGATLTPLNIKLADNQFIEIKKYSALQIASALGVKPYHIGDYASSSYSSTEAQQLSFYVDTLLYTLKQYEEELSYKLLSREEFLSGKHFKTDITSILRLDFETQINTFSKAVNNFIYTPNEARIKLNLDTVEGGDELLGNGASIPVKYAGMQYLKEQGKEGEDGGDNKERKD
jgi:HK97 family phage portal protein